MKTLPIVRNRKIWFTISGVMIAASIIMLATFGLRFGIDFTGGSLMELSFAKSTPAVTTLQQDFAGFGYSDAVIQTIGQNGVNVRIPTISQEKHAALLASIQKKYSDATERRFESVGPTVGDELRSKAIWSLALVLLAIACYVAYAFRKVSRPVAAWKYGVITLLTALLHDVLLPVGVFSALGHFQGVEINSDLVAAILTILGYSVHDTIVVFDRVRENLTKTSGTFEDIVERSVNETLGRSINTSLTAFLPLVAIFALGGESLRYFSLALMIGLVTGTYSSIFLAAPSLVVMQKRAKK